MSTLQTVLDDLVASGEGVAEVTIGGLALVGIAVAGHAAIALYRAVQEGQPALGHILGIIIGLRFGFGGCRKLSSEGCFLSWRLPGLAGVGEIFPRVGPRQHTLSSQAVKNLGHDLDQPALQRPGF